RSGGSILQDADGLFGDGESISDASVFIIAGGISSIDNSSIFDELLMTGNFGSHIPHKGSSDTAAGKGSVYWDTGGRAMVHNQVFTSMYNQWGLHFNAN